MVRLAAVYGGANKRIVQRLKIGLPMEERICCIFRLQGAKADGSGARLSSRKR